MPYEKFQEWLNSCPVEIINYQDFTDQFEITFKVPLEVDIDVSKTLEANKELLEHPFYN